MISIVGICFVRFLLFGIGFYSASISSEMVFLSRPINLEWMKEKVVKPFPLVDFSHGDFYLLLLKPFPLADLSCRDFFLSLLKPFPLANFNRGDFFLSISFFLIWFFFCFFFEWDVFLSHPMTLELMKEKVVKFFPPC